MTDSDELGSARHALRQPLGDMIALAAIPGERLRTAPYTSRTDRLLHEVEDAVFYRYVHDGGPLIAVCGALVAQQPAAASVGAPCGSCRRISPRGSLDDRPSNFEVIELDARTDPEPVPVPAAVVPAPRRDVESLCAAAGLPFGGRHPSHRRSTGRGGVLRWLHREAA
ncbi:hypothetical protein ACPZ19_04720 [Amycolatopsis lurida]